MNCFNLLKMTRGYSIWLSGIKWKGLYIDYWSDGQLMEKSYWKNGKKHGERLLYYSNGQLMKKSYWNNDKKISEEEEEYEINK